MLGQGVHVGLDNPFGILDTLDEQAKPGWQQSQRTLLTRRSLAVSKSGSSHHNSSFEANWAPAAMTVIVVAAAAVTEQKPDNSMPVINLKLLQPPNRSRN